MKNKTVFKIKSYWAPTPARMRKIGDTLLAVFSITSMSSSMFSENKAFAIVSLLVGVLGKIFTNFFTETPVNED